MKRLWLVVVAVVVLAFAVPAAQAITNGVDDANEHPYVGQLFFYVPDDVDPRFTDPGSWYNCTGTLISPTVVLTAGHCTWGVGADGEPATRGGNDVWVNFSAAPTYDGIPLSRDYIPDRNEERYEDRVAWLATKPAWRRGTADAHPSYMPNAFFMFDAGVVILDEPVAGMGTGSNKGELPSLGYLERFQKSGKNSQLFTPVGYGLEKVLPIGVDGGDTRRKATSKLVNLNGTFGIPYGVSAVFSNNMGVNQGGTCFGDSGGPVFVAGTNQLVGVTSYGISPNCTGTDGTYRLDQRDDLDWLADVLAGRP